MTGNVSKNFEMNLELAILLQTGQRYRSISNSSSHFAFFFLRLNLSWSWCCAMKLIYTGLNIEQLLNFSLLHNDYVIWINNVPRMQSRGISATKKSLLESNVLQVLCEPKRSGLSPQLKVRDPCHNLIVALYPWRMVVLSPYPEMKFSIKYRSELTAVVRCLHFYRKTLHSFIYERSAPAYGEQWSFSHKESANQDLS